MNLLVDGYNVLHVSGVMGTEMTPAELHKARVQLVVRIANAVGSKSNQATVVFDAARAPRDVPEFQRQRGVAIYFTARGESADDLIERLIQANATPKNLTVVSDDQRILRAGRQRGCAIMKSEAFLSWLDDQTAKRQPASERNIKTKPLTAQERDDWLREFGHLDDDPSLGKRPLFEGDSFDFSS